MYRSRLIKNGATALLDAELLAVAADITKPIAKRLLGRYGSLAGIMDAGQESLCREPGVSTACYARLQAVNELHSRQLLAQLKQGTVIDEPSYAINFIQLKIGRSKREIFVCLFLDAQNGLIEYQEVFKGTLNMTNIHPREIARQCLVKNAASIIVGHNHPSGVATPSRSDKDITKRIAMTLRLINVKLLDHIIVAQGESYSLGEGGDIDYDFRELFDEIFR